MRPQQIFSKTMSNSRQGAVSAHSEMDKPDKQALYVEVKGKS